MAGDGLKEHRLSRRFAENREIHLRPVHATQIMHTSSGFHNWRSHLAHGLLLRPEVPESPWAASDDSQAEGSQMRFLIEGEAH